MHVQLLQDLFQFSVLNIVSHTGLLITISLLLTAILFIDIISMNSNLKFQSGTE